VNNKLPVPIESLHPLPPQGGNFPLEGAGGENGEQLT